MSTNPQAEETRRTIQAALRVLVVATVILYAGLIAVSVWTYNGAASNRDALCALREDVEKRVATSEGFLAANPKGVAGIDAAALKTSIANSKRTIEALSGINC